MAVAQAAARDVAVRIIAQLLVVRARTRPRRRNGIARLRQAVEPVSRASEEAAIYIDNRAKLTEALGIRDGSQVGAIDETLTKAKSAAIAISTPVRAVGIAI